MRFCVNHWECLQTAVAEQGMWHLVTVPDGSQAALLAYVSKAPAETKFNDPLILAAVAICSKLSENGSKYLLWGDWCPLCEHEAHAAKGKDDLTIEEWVRECIKALRGKLERSGALDRTAVMVQ